MKSTLKTSTCKGCGKKVYFVKDFDGKTQILDAVAPVWAQIDDTVRREQDSPEYPGGPPLYEIVKEPSVKRIAAYVSHFSTCPKAGEFSKKGKS